MKCSMLTILFLGLSAIAAMGQNKVTVSQQGSGNSVSINQDAEKKTADTHCKEARMDAEGNSNTIKVSTTDNQQDEFLLHQSNAHLNELLVRLADLYELDALQQGDANSISILLPETGTNPHTLSTSQQGNANKLSARMASPASDVSVSQSGQGNSVKINPCRSDKE